MRVRVRVRVCACACACVRARDLVDEVMDTRLGASAHRSIQAALSHWDTVRARYSWPRVILSDDGERGGKLATFVLHMAEDTNLVGASISNYVWAFRSWLKFQRQLDPIYGVVDWEDFMQGVAVRTHSTTSRGTTPNCSALPLPHRST